MSAAKRPSMADVAALAGVSSQTVSRVLAGSKEVRENTRQVVEEAIRQLDYHPNAAARRLATGRTRTIGMVMLETLSYARSAIWHEVERASRVGGYELSTAGIDALTASQVARALRRLAAQGVDGLVLSVPLAEVDASVEEIIRAVPTVAIDGGRTPSCDLVAVDQYAAGVTATRHLLELGHETVWYVSGPELWSETVGRTAGWRDTLAQAGAEQPPVMHGDWTPDSGYRCGRLLGRAPDVTAIFVANDDMAFGLMHALRELGRDVPEDVSVAGMDDTPFAPYAVAPLTTIRQSFAEVADRAVARLLSVIERGSRPYGGHAELLQPELIRRGSTAPRRRADGPDVNAGEEDTCRVGPAAPDLRRP